MPNPISIFLNKKRDFYVSDFELFANKMKQLYPTLQVKKSAENGYVYGWLKGQKEAEFKYDSVQRILYTDLSATQIEQILEK